MAKLLIAA